MNYLLRTRKKNKIRFQFFSFFFCAMSFHSVNIVTWVRSERTMEIFMVQFIKKEKHFCNSINTSSPNRQSNIKFGRKPISFSIRIRVHHSLGYENDTLLIFPRKPFNPSITMSAISSFRFCRQLFASITFARNKTSQCLDFWKIVCKL